MTKETYLKLNEGKNYHEMLIPLYGSHMKLFQKMLKRIDSAVEYYEQHSTLLCQCSPGEPLTALNIMLEFTKPADVNFDIIGPYKLESYHEFQDMSKVVGARSAMAQLKGVSSYIKRMNKLLENAREAYGWVIGFIDKTIHYQENSQPVMNRGNICRAFTPVSSLPLDLVPGDTIVLSNPRKKLEEGFKVIMVYPFDDGYQVQDADGNIRHFMDEVDYSDTYYSMTPENRLVYGMCWHMKRYTYLNKKVLSA